MRPLSVVLSLIIPLTVQAQGNRGDSVAVSMTLVGRGRVSAVYDLKAAPPYLYALERGMMRVLDVRDLKKTHEVGSLELARPRSRMALRASYLYLTGFNEPLAVIDISNRARPRLTFEDLPSSRTSADGFELADSVAYVVRTNLVPGEAPALVLDVLDLARNPAHPERVGTVDLAARVNGGYGGIAQAGGRAFVIVTRTAGAPPRSRLIVIDARRINDPRIERTFFFPDGKLYKDIEVRGDLIYLLQPQSASDPDAGLAVYRMSDNSDLEFLGEALNKEIFNPVDLILNGTVVYATVKGGGPLVTFDVSNPREPRIIHTYKQAQGWTGGLGMTLVDDRLFVAGDTGPSPILDVSEPNVPRLAGRYEHDGGSVSGISIAGKLAVLESTSDLILFDVSKPEVPKRVGRHVGVPLYDKWQWDHLVAVNGRRALVSYETRPAQVVDLSDPLRPKVLAEFTPRGVVRASFLTSRYAVLAFGASRTAAPEDAHAGNGVEIVDLHDPHKPRAVSTIDVAQPICTLLQREDHLVAGHDDGSLSIIDIWDPIHPRMLGQLSSGTSIVNSSGTQCLALSANGNFAYVISRDRAAAQTATLTVVDLSEPARPKIRNRMNFDATGDTQFSIVLQRRLLVILGDGGKLTFLDLTDPASPRLTWQSILPHSVYATGLAINGSYLYVAANEDGFLIYRITTPTLN